MNISNITARIAKVSRLLAQARALGETEDVERYEDELNDLEDELEDAEAAIRGSFSHTGD